ncbi:hypothetical protein V6M85_09315 [Sulfolobus tengchongensis]|uniref:Uncharacterized protein n=1 Tax=Sulfolobus tengchongensis TaxID=207809 RepID=A0AAX4KXS6_9CREN
MNSRALSNTISAIILVFIVLVVFIPILFYLQNLSQSNVSTQSVVNNYVYLQNLQVSQVTTGHPSFYYNGSSIYIEYSNGTFEPPSNLTIVGILYLNTNGVWTNITSLNYPLIISKGQVLNLPSYVANRPIIIVTSLGNIFFLQPGSSIGPFATGGKGGVEILTQIYQTSGPLSVSTNISTNINGNFVNYTTPVSFPNQSGSFKVKAPTYVYYQNSKGQIITGTFHNWIVLGKAIVNSTVSQGIQVTLEGQPVVLIGNYSPLLTTVNLNVITNDNNVNVIVNVDGQNYTIKGSTTISIYAGYANITVYTLQFNDTSQQSNGVIMHYVYSNSTYNGKTYITKSFLVFIPPTNANPKVYINYKNNYNYYRVYISAINAPSSVCLILNNTVYNYNNTYWIMGGKYSFHTTGELCIMCEINNPYLNYSYNARNVTLSYQNGTRLQYNFPNIPFYIIINQPMNITVIYGITEYWYYL